MKPNYLKMPADLVRRSNQKGLLTSVIFFYELKGINTSGHFKKDSLLTFLSTKLRCSKSSICINIAKLKKLGLILELKTEYRLANYDTLFALLDYDLTQQSHRKGTFKIFKISNNKNVLLWFCYTELMYSLSKQRFLIKQNGGLIPQEFKELGYTKPTISTRGLARILGYKSSSMGYKILSYFEDKELIELKRQRDENGNALLSEFIYSVPIKKTFKLKNKHQYSNLFYQSL